MFKDKYVAAVIAAAGRGTRMGSEIPKQYMTLAGRTVLDTTLHKFEKSNEVDEIVLVVGRDDLEYVKSGIAVNYNKIKKVVPGGRVRTESVFEGIKAVSPCCGIVLIHDGVRPLVSYSLISGCVEGAYNYGACIPVIDVADTIKEVSGDGIVRNTLDRTRLKAVQTPQAFDYALIRDCYMKALTEGAEFTDDASIAEYYGHEVRTIEGLPRNIKITTPFDLRIAEIFASIY